MSNIVYPLDMAADTLTGVEKIMVADDNASAIKVATVNELRDFVVKQTITSGVTTSAPSQDAVFNELAARMQYRGNFSLYTTYLKDSVVTHDGTAFVALTEGTDIDPTDNPSVWRKLVDLSNFKGNILLVANLDAQVTNGWWQIDGAVTAATALVGGTWIASTVHVMGKAGTAPVSQFLSIETTTGAHICTRRSANSGSTWTAWIRVGQDAIDAIDLKQDIVTNLLAIEYWQEDEPTPVVGKAWYKESTTTLKLGMDVMGTPTWLTGVKNNNEYYTFNGIRYIWNGTEMYEVSDTTYYTENAVQSGTFTLHRNEVLSFPNTIEFTLNINLSAPIAGRANIYTLCGNMGAVLRTISISCTDYTIVWAGAAPPVFEVSKPFEISIMEVAPTILQAIFKQF